jgi:peptidoglycan glycosyltransferase
MFLGIFILMIGYFVYFQFFLSEDFINSPFNRRQDSFAEQVIRGNIVAANGNVLAETQVSSNGTETRNYPFGAVFAHAVGFDSNGKSGIESFANFNLLRSHAFFVEQIMNGMREEKNPGDTVVTTLNVAVQQAAFNALGNRRGAVLVMEPRTGRVLAWVSKPDFNPNTIAANWDRIVADENNSVLLNRVSQGLYPPGSTFKSLTALEYLNEHDGNADFSYNCSGSITVDGFTIRCFNNTRHGQVDLKTAFAKSCNCAFASMGLDFNMGNFNSLSSNMLFGTSMPTQYPTARSRFSLSETDHAGIIMQTAIGQGETLMTPLHLNLITCAIANNGVAMKPNILDHTENNNGIVVTNFPSESFARLLSGSDVTELQEMMEAVVESGTGTGLRNRSYTAAGKTGSAEYLDNGTRRSHAWFTGYAHKDGQEDIAITVIVEAGGTGGAVAVPMVRRVFDTYFD